MARRLNPRERGLLVVLALGAVVVGYFKIRSGGSLFGAPPAAEEKETKPWGEPPVVEMALLTRATTDYDANGRNLFDYYVPPPPRVEYVAPPPPPPPPQPPVFEVQQRPFLPPPEPAPPQPSFLYLGYLGPKEKKIAVFSSGEDILLAQVGDVVQEQFRLLEFRYEAVVMGYEDAPHKGKTTELKMRPK